MLNVIDAVYQNGVFRPTNPPDLLDGTAVRLSVVPTSLPTVGPPDPAFIVALLKRIEERPMEPGGDETVTARDHDRTLYRGPSGAR